MNVWTSSNVCRLFNGVYVIFSIPRILSRVGTHLFHRMYMHAISAQPPYPKAIIFNDVDSGMWLYCECVCVHMLGCGSRVRVCMCMYVSNVACFLKKNRSDLLLSVTELRVSAHARKWKSADKRPVPEFCINKYRIVIF